MNNDMEYYKSLISDEEVIKALIKDSKEREGELPKEKTRVRPNINFFQRTVTNLVSSNKRITSNQGNVVLRERRKIECKIKSPHDLIKETILSNKVKTIQPEGQSNMILKENLKNYIEKKRNKIRQLKQQQLKREALQKTQSVSLNLNITESNSTESMNTGILRIDSDSSSDSEDSVVSISSAESNSPNAKNVIKLSDSDSDLAEEITNNKSLNNSKIGNHRKRKKLG